MLQLYDHQEITIDKVRQSLKKHQRVLLTSPTGSGKTAMTVHMMGRAAERGISSMFCVHQDELLQQTSTALWNQRLEHGMIASGRRPSKLAAQVASVQTLVRRLDRYKEPGLIIIDEAHRSASNSYLKVLEAYPKAKVIGLTATPRRTDGRPLTMFEDMVLGPRPRELIDAGYLCDFEIYAPESLVDMTGVPLRMNEYATDAAEEVVDQPTITGNAVDHYIDNCMGKRCVVMCLSIKHAQNVAEEYRARGIPAQCVHGQMTDIGRAEAFENFRQGITWVLTNVQLMVEGVDIPAIEVIQWLRPTKSLIVWLQGNGRGLRTMPGKDKLLILDHVKGWEDHWPPDYPHEWTLEGRKKRGKRELEEEDEGPISRAQQCKNCYYVFSPGPLECPHCGMPVEQLMGRVVQEVEGTLKKVDLEAARKQLKFEIDSTRDFDELIKLGIRRKMNNPAEWAAHKIAARENRRANKTDFDDARKRMIKIKQAAMAPVSNMDFI